MSELSQVERVEMARANRAREEAAQSRHRLIAHLGLILIAGGLLGYMRWMEDITLMEQIIMVVGLIMILVYFFSLMMDAVQGRHVRMIHDAVRQSNDMYSAPPAHPAPQPAPVMDPNAVMMTLLQLMKNETLTATDHKYKMERMAASEEQRRQRPHSNYTFADDSDFTVNPGGFNDHTRKGIQ